MSHEYQVVTENREPRWRAVKFSHDYGRSHKQTSFNFNVFEEASHLKPVTNGNIRAI